MYKTSITGGIFHPHANAKKFKAKMAIFQNIQILPDFLQEMISLVSNMHHNLFSQTSALMDSKVGTTKNMPKITLAQSSLILLIVKLSRC